MRFYPYFDTHCDTMLKMYTQKLPLSDSSLMVNLGNMMRYRPSVQVFALFNEGSFRKNDMIDIFSYFKKECAKFKSKISVEKTSSGIRRNFKQRRAIALLAIEGLGNQPGFTPDDVDFFSDMGIRFMSLCWNGDNVLCGGSNNNRSGLTPLGKQTLARMEKRKIILDVSHMSDKSFWQALESYSLPICATHSLSRALCATNRNLTDCQFKAIAAGGGVCGVNFYPPLLGGDSPDVNRVIEHIEHFLALGGEDSVGIGADFDGIDCVASGLENSARVYKLLNALLSLNYKENTVNKIAFYNFYKFFSNFEI